IMADEWELFLFLFSVNEAFYSTTSIIIQLFMCVTALILYVIFTIAISTMPFQFSCRLILLVNSLASFVMVIVHVLRSLVYIIEIPPLFASDNEISLAAGIFNNLVLLITSVLAVHSFYAAKRRYKTRKGQRTLESRYIMNTVAVLCCAIILMTRNRPLRKRLSILFNLQFLAPPRDVNTDSSASTYFSILEQHWK
ncbi:hypothetical protein PFISCL1PPCAC_26309, partial [Pristionchus fissidentatus]